MMIQHQIIGSVVSKLILSLITICLLSVLWYLTPIKKIHSIIRQRYITTTIIQNKVETSWYGNEVLKSETLKVDTIYSGASKDTGTYGQIVSINLLGDTLYSEIKRE